MTNRVFIPCAGIGSRLGELTSGLPKQLIEIGGRPVITYLIEKFSADTEYVVALGYRGDLLRQFLTICYPNRNFTFVDVAPFTGPNSGLGRTLLACKAELQTPFVFLASDTIVLEDIPNPEYDWVGVSDSVYSNQYRTVEHLNGIAIELHEKGSIPQGHHSSYIGLAGIFKFKEFWTGLEVGLADGFDSGEADGIRHLLSTATGAVSCLGFTWFDTGNYESLTATRAHFRSPIDAHVLPKEGEAIWFVGQEVIKYSSDVDFIKQRVERASHLEGFVPTVSSSTTNMYRYSLAQGEVLSRSITPFLFQKLLSHCSDFWQSGDLSDFDFPSFRQRCYNFYKTKTWQRVSLFLKNQKSGSSSRVINGVEVADVGDQLARVDWNRLSEGIPSRFHGDLHFENILWQPHSSKFIFLDWRQNFDGDLSSGDLYYDLAKLLHGMIVSHPMVAKDRFFVNFLDDERLEIGIDRSDVLVTCEQIFCNWLETEGFDRNRVYLLTSLIFLNIAPLHHAAYGQFLFGLGRLMLANGLADKNEPLFHPA